MTLDGNDKNNMSFFFSFSNRTTTREIKLSKYNYKYLLIKLNTLSNCDF